MSDRTTSTFATDQQAQQRQQRRQELSTSVVAVLDAQRDKYSGMLPGDVTWEEFRSCFLTAVQRNYRLLEADRDSLWLALQDCANVGLRPDGKEAALVIFGDDEEDEEGNVVPSKAKGQKKVVFMPMTFGLCRLVYNTGLVAAIRARCVYKGEYFREWEEDGKQHYEYRRMIDPNFDDDPVNIIGAFAVVEMKDGSYNMDFLSRKQIERRRAVSKAKNGPWKSWYDEQSMKTVLKHLFKRVQRSRELQGVTEMLDKDDSLPTIDGTAQEIHGNVEHDKVRHEFTGDAGRTNVQEPSRKRTTSDGATQTTTATVTATVNNTTADKTKPDDPDAWRDNPGAEQQRQSTAAQQAPGAPVEARQDAGPTQEEGFEAWLVDHEGVETRAEPYTSEMTFAHALVELCAKFPASKADILDQNAGAIADASEDNKARAIIEAVRNPPAQEDTVVRNETADDSFRATVLEVPQTPKGGPHWPNYIDTAQRAIDACPSVAAMHAWLAANEPTWKGKSVQAETKIKRHFDATLAKMTGQPPPADGDQDANTLNTIRRSTADCKVADVLMAFWGSAAVKNAAMRFQAEGKGNLRTEIKSIFQKRHHELTGRDGLFVFADELR